jgi:hypothetical protein
MELNEYFKQNKPIKVYLQIDMKYKVLNFLIILTSMFGYLEWSGNNHIFLYEAEAEILSKLFINPISVFHPLTILPIIGQLFLLITLFQKKPNKIIYLIGISGLGLLLGFMFIVGLLTLNFKIIASTVPFISMSIYTIMYHKKENQQR